MVQKFFQPTALVIASVLLGAFGYSMAKKSSPTPKGFVKPTADCATEKAKCETPKQDPLYASPVRAGTFDIFHLDQDGATKLNCYVTVHYSYDIQGCDNFGNVVLTEHYSYDKTQRTRETRTDRSSEFVAGEVLKRLIARGTCRSNSEGLAWLGNSSNYENPCNRDYYEHKASHDSSDDESSKKKKEKEYY